MPLLIAAGYNHFFLKKIWNQGLAYCVSLGFMEGCHISRMCIAVGYNKKSSVPHVTLLYFFCEC